MLREAKTLLTAMLLAVAWHAGAAAAPPVTVQATDDFHTEAELARQKRLPLLVMFSADYCPYCMQLEEEFLKPMLISGDYDDKVIIRKVKLDGFAKVRDFDGRRIDIDEFASRYSVQVTPTVIFLDPQGQQLAEKLVGITTPDFYGGYLDKAIETSLDRLRRNKPLAVSITD